MFSYLKSIDFFFQIHSAVQILRIKIWMTLWRGLISMVTDFAFLNLKLFILFKFPCGFSDLLVYKIKERCYEWQSPHLTLSFLFPLVCMCESVCVCVCVCVHVCMCAPACVCTVCTRKFRLKRVSH